MLDRRKGKMTDEEREDLNTFKHELVKQARWWQWKAEALEKESEQLKSENAALRERLEKSEELPVKIGDTVYFIPTYNGNPIWGVQKGVVQMVGITQRGYHVKIRDRADFNKTYMFGKSAFLLKEQAEARLAELNRRINIEVKKLD